MIIHPFWIICICVRLFIAFFIKYNTNNLIVKIMNLLLTFFGMGFMYKGFIGSNNEKQLAKVFWHETRYVHGINHLLASYYLYKKNKKMNMCLLLSDICFSFIYRIITNQ